MLLKVVNSSFAIPLSSVREVLALGNISPVPNMPSYFAGLINLRGKIVSVVNLKKCLSFLETKGASDTFDKRSCVVIVEVEGRIIGAIVDDVVEVQSVPEGEIERAIDELANKEVYEGVIKRAESGLSPILNLKTALKLTELVRLEEKH